MSDAAAEARRVLIVGAGFAGLSAAARLAQAGLPVTVCESREIGWAASSRNQGWLHSGAVFAREHPELARMCLDSLHQTLEFCPECVEPGHRGMAYLFTRPETLVQPWLEAWQSLDMKPEALNRDMLHRYFARLDTGLVKSAFVLPDRSIRPDVLLQKLAMTARNAGAELRVRCPVRQVLTSANRIRGLELATGEEIDGKIVLLATGGRSRHLVPAANAEIQTHRTRLFKTHLLALRPEISQIPFCIPDANLLNHLPHAWTSVFGTGYWEPAVNLEDESEEVQVDWLWAQVCRFIPGLREQRPSRKSWAGTTIQHFDGFEPKDSLVGLSRVVSHTELPDGTNGLFSLYCGRATLWPELAEQTRQAVINSLDDFVPHSTAPPWTSIS